MDAGSHHSVVRVPRLPLAAEPNAGIGNQNARNNDPSLAFAHAGDHALVYALLRAANQTPSYEDFVAWLDEPSYEPSDRLLIKRGEQIIAHVQLLQRTAWFDGVKIALGSLQDLAILPEFSQGGYEQRLLAAAEEQLLEAQSVVSLVRTDRPEPFRAAGWADVRGQGYSEVGIGDLLAHLSAQASLSSRRLRALQIRRWRHVELDAVRAVYSAAVSNCWGALHRAEAYWRWLVGRKAHSDLIVAVEGDDQWQELQADSQIVGYAVNQGARILEVCGMPEHARATPRLLVRACQDAIEQDHHTISLHTPASDPLHELIVTAGGKWSGPDHGDRSTLLVKLLDPGRWVEAIYPILRRRAKTAGLPRPLQLCFDTGEVHYRLLVTRRSSRLIPDDAATADVICDPEVFASLLLGNLNITKAGDAGRIRFANDEVRQRVASLFPPALFWQSEWDVRRF
jgi:predicted acetyltransferase